MQKIAPPGILLSDRVYRKPRKPGLKTLPQRESRGRKSNCSLSWHHHRSSAENAAEIAIQVLGFIATREGADRWNFIKLEAKPSSPGDGRMPKSGGARVGLDGAIVGL